MQVSPSLDCLTKAMPLNCQTFTPLMQVGEGRATALPPTPLLKAKVLASNAEQAEDALQPLEMRTRNIIARTPVAGPSPASVTPAAAFASAGATLTSLSTPQSKSHQVSFTSVFFCNRSALCLVLQPEQQI